MDIMTIKQRDLSKLSRILGGLKGANKGLIIVNRMSKQVAMNPMLPIAKWPYFFDSKKGLTKKCPCAQKVMTNNPRFKKVWRNAPFMPSISTLTRNIHKKKRMFTEICSPILVICSVYLDMPNLFSLQNNSNHLKVVENKQVAKFFKRMVGILQ